ncbi:MAG TPA: DegV family protein [Acidimicrobiales bacterium]|nr:DegV family protein [Acidimicrobiales bacterium]
MRKVAVITDSSACLPRDLVHRLGIQVLPISVHLPGGELELSEEEGEEGVVLPDGAEDEELSAANRPFVTEYLAAIEGPGFESAVVVTPAIEFAAMYRNAALAAELAERPTVTIDARTAAAGQALVVLAGAEVAARGAPLEEVVRAVEDAAARVELVASLATLESIRRSGPIPDATLGEDGNGAERARTLFRMHGGEVELLGDPSGAEEALRAMAAHVAADRPGGVERVTVFHAGARELADQLAALVGGVDFVSGFSLAMQIHTGRGVVGVAWLPSASSA